MAIKTWQVNSLQRELSSGYVKKVIYRINGEDGPYKFKATGEVDLPRPETLVPYSDLTEEQVLAWTKLKLDATKEGTVAAIEAAVENGVNEQKTPTTGMGKPW